MHVAAMKPVALSSADVPAALVASARSLEPKAAEDGRHALPASRAVAEIVAKMRRGRCRST